MRSYLSITFHSTSLFLYPYSMHSVATFSVCFRGLSRLDDDDDLGKPCVFSSSCCCCEKSRPNSATLGFSRFAGVPVRVRERAVSYRAFLRLPKGPDSSGGRRGLRVSLREVGQCLKQINARSIELTLCKHNPKGGGFHPHLWRAPQVGRRGTP